MTIIIDISKTSIERFKAPDLDKMAENGKRIRESAKVRSIKLIDTLYPTLILSLKFKSCRVLLSDFANQSRAFRSHASRLALCSPKSTRIIGESLRSPLVTVTIIRERKNPPSLPLPRPSRPAGRRGGNKCKSSNIYISRWRRQAVESGVAGNGTSTPSRSAANGREMRWIWPHRA